MKKTLRILITVMLCAVMVSNSVIYSFAVTNLDEGYLIRDCLTENQKAVYDAFSQQPFSESFTVTLTQPLEYVNAYAEEPDEFFDDMQELAGGGLYGFAYDNPQYLWFYTIAFGVSHYDYEKRADGKYDVTIDKVNIYPRRKASAFSSNDDLKAKTELMMNTVNSVKISGYTRYDKLKSIHDTVINMVTYDPNVSQSSENPTSHFATGVFNAPNIAVCEGYAAAFKLLCDRENIPCVFVVGKLHGGGHAWNYVKMDDGKWYAVDCTRDDNDGKSEMSIFYDDFVVGADSVAIHFDDKDTSFSDTHIPDGKIWLFSDFSFKYPSLETGTYTHMILSADSKATISTDRTRLIIPPDAQADMICEAPAGFMFMVMENKTGAAIQLLSYVDFTTTYNYTLVMRGDVVADGQVTADDYQKQKDIAVGTDSETKYSTDEFMSADMDGDGAVDGFDLYYMNLYLNQK